MTRKRVAVIGSGPLGIGAVKCLKEENIEPVCFERTGHYGGLWRYHDEDFDGLASVMKTTVINTSKEMGALSDWPPPEDIPNYMHNTEVYECLTLYAKENDVLRHIKFNKEVIRVEMAKDYDSTGCLNVKTKDTITGETEEETFDGVLVCIGHHVFPNIPILPGKDKFKGKILHTHSLKSVEEFADKNVVVLGVGNSGMDAAVEISSVAKKVYLSTRRGTWVLPRVGPNGIPFDMAVTSRFMHALFELFPMKVSEWFMQSTLNKWFDHSLYNLRPNHGVFSQHPTVSDILPVKVLTGVVKIRNTIREFKEDGVIFQNDSEVTKVDSVVLATGYKIMFPFLSEDLTTVKDNRVHLYKFMYPPHLPHATLAIIGLVQSLGAVFPIGEAQCRLASLVINGKIELPDQKTMVDDIKKHNEEIDKRYVKSERHTIQVDYISYLDEVCEMFKAKPNLWKIFFIDLRLWFALIFGPSLPYQYRLHGPHPWEGARNAILSYKERVIKPLRKDCGHTKSSNGVFDVISEFLNKFNDLLFGFFKK